MTTRDDLKARILDDLERDAANWGTRVENCISDAIQFYQPHRFYFNETRSVTFNTVAGTETYTFPTDITPEFYRIDKAVITISGNVTRLRRVDYAWLEQVADNNTSQGQPYNYAYVDRTLRIYPNPNGIYAVRLLGHVKLAEPTSGSDATNEWINEAYELIRSRAKLIFAAHIIQDETLASIMGIADQSALKRLRGATMDKAGSGDIVPTEF